MKTLPAIKNENPTRHNVIILSSTKGAMNELGRNTQNTSKLRSE